MQSELFIFNAQGELFSYIVDSEAFRFGAFIRQLESEKPVLVLADSRVLNDGIQDANEFVFLGEKHPKKSLTSYLHKWTDRPGVVFGSSFLHTGQLLRSIKTFLRNSEESKARKVLSFLTIPTTLMEQVKSELLAQQTMKVWNAKREQIPLVELMTYVKYDKRASAYKGRSMKSELVRKLVAKFALDSMGSVIILGETGTGKAVVARELYRMADMKGQFIVVNCSSIPEELFETEIFGHARGAFTGATSDKKGLWELAQDGVLFLDEIGDLNLHNQAKFLTALDRKKIRRIGDNKEISVNARIISATNKKLENMIQRGEFREDLYYRISTLKIETAPLRERKEDIPDLIKKYWKNNNELNEEIISLLLEKEWPGNVRSIKLFLERLNVFFGDKVIRPEHINALNDY